MTTVSIFAGSGLLIVLLLATKRLGEKRKKTFFLHNLISKGDIRIRGLYHKLVRLYSEDREKTLFFFQKQLPIHSKNSLNKLITFLKEKREQYIGNMRDTRLLRKSDGISEFFKNMSEIEKGNGEIHDAFENDPSDITVLKTPKKR